MWVHYRSDPPAQVRYAVDGDRLVCFGDDSLSSVPDGAQVSAAVYEIAGGRQVAGLNATLHTLQPDEVDANALVDLIGNMPLGRTIAEVNAGLDHYRTHRRIVEIVP